MGPTIQQTCKPSSDEPSFFLPKIKYRGLKKQNKLNISFNARLSKDQIFCDPSRENSIIKNRALFKLSRLQNWIGKEMLDESESTIWRVRHEYFSCLNEENGVKKK